MARMPSLDNLTYDQTKQLATECLSLLTFDDLLTVLNDVLDDTALAELAAQLTTPDP